MGIRRGAFLVAITSACLMLVACGIPQSVKHLSKELTLTQDAFHSTLEAYFSKMEAFVADRIARIEATMESVSAEINDTYKKQAVLQLANGSDQEEVMDSLVANVLGNASSDAEKMRQWHDSLAKLKKSHAGMLAAHGSILESQRKLDEYLQLEKADEAVLNELLLTIGVKRTQFDNYLNTFTNVYDQLNTSLEGGSGT